LAFEYGWTVDYILSLPLEIIEYLLEAIKMRKEKEYKALKQTPEQQEDVIPITNPQSELFLAGMGKLKIIKEK
jgi:hypothetical protein